MRATHEAYEDWVELRSLSQVLADGKIRGVRVKVVSKGGQVKIVRRPIQHIYPLEVQSRSTGEEVRVEESHSTLVAKSSDPIRPQSTRKSAAHAQDRIVGVMMEDELDELLRWC